MKTAGFYTILTAGITLSSCVYYSNPVPDIPHRSMPSTAVPAEATAPVTTQQPTPKQTAKPKPTPKATPAAKQTPKQKPAAKPATPATPKKTTITPPQPVAEPTPAPTPTPASTPAPEPKPAAKDPSLITNDGPIPYATPVPGDPTRVYNPLDPSVRIRILNKKTGQPYPRGTKLKVRGTNFFFYVP